jgi:hypothetical protein
MTFRDSPPGEIQSLRKNVSANSTACTIAVKGKLGIDVASNVPRVKHVTLLDRKKTPRRGGGGESGEEEEHYKETKKRAIRRLACDECAVNESCCDRVTAAKRR